MQIIGTCAVPQLQSQLNCSAMTSRRLLKIYQIPTGLVLSLPRTAVLTAIQKVVKDILFGMERTKMEALAIQLTSSQTPRAPSTSEGSRRGRRRATKLNPHAGQSHNTNICWQVKAFYTSMDESYSRREYIGHCTALPP